MGTKLKVITMNKIILILITASMFFTKGYAQQAEVLTLGVSTSNFPIWMCNKYPKKTR